MKALSARVTERSIESPTEPESGTDKKAVAKEVAKGENPFK